MCRRRRLARARIAAMTPKLSPVAENLERVRQQIARACERAGRRVEEITLVAVSKTFPAEAILAAYDAGLRVFGENRVQEFEAKRQEGSAGIPELVAEASGLSAELNRQPPPADEYPFGPAGSDIAANPTQSIHERGEVIQLVPETATHPTIREPAIDLVSTMPPPKHGSEPDHAQLL